MQQILFRIPVPHFLQNWLGPNVPVFGYGLMMVFGFFAAALLATYLARRKGLNPELFMNAALIGLVAGIVGARTSHVIENWSDFTKPELSAGQNFLNMINVRAGGLTFYGGFLLAFPTLVLYGIYKKVPIGLGMDIIAPALMVAYGFGRIGCFLNGCCYGAECQVPWAVEYPYHSIPYVEQYEKGTLQHTPAPELLRPLPPEVMDRPPRASVKPDLVAPEQARQNALLKAAAAREHSNWVHPVQLYSTFTSFLLAGLLLAYFTVPHADGRVFALMCLLEGTTRFLLEMLRVEPPVVGRMSLSMLIGVIVAAVGVALWIAFGRSGRRGDGDAYAPVVQPA